MYALINGQSLKVHRVLQLAFCQLVDIVDGQGISFSRIILVFLFFIMFLYLFSEFNNAFRLVNSQKSITLIARDSDDKLNWMQTIQMAINMAKSVKDDLSAGILTVI